MFPLLGAAGGALSLLNSVLQSSTSNGASKTGGNLLSSLEQTLTGNSGQQQSQAVVGSGQGASPLSSGTLSALISLQGQDGANGQGGLFSKLDANGDGTISKSEFENTLSQAGIDTSSADNIFNKLDADGDGSISKGEMAKARGGHHHHAGGKGGASGQMNPADLTGASSQTTSNSDGSSTTTITYADGSSVSMTSSAASSSTSSGSSGGSSQNNLLEQLIKLQSQLTANSGATTSTTA